MNNSQANVSDFLDVEDVAEVTIERGKVFDSIQHYEMSDMKCWQTVKPTYEVGDVMRDINKKSKTKKDKNWALRKTQNSEIAEIMTALNIPESKRHKFWTCAEVLLFAISANNDMKLKNAWFCKDKLCPICQWRRSLKLGFWNKAIIKKASTDLEACDGRYVFLTLTVKNCRGEDLKDTIKMIHKGFDKMFRRAVLKKYCLGFIRSLEVTYNEQTREFHPHLHVLMLMRGSYFGYKTVSGKRKLTGFLSQSDYIDYWQRACDLDYKPSVDIRSVKRRKGRGNTLEKAVLEISKYAFKPIDIKNLSDFDKRYVISSLIKGLARVRQVGYGGLFKKIYKELSVDEENLINIMDSEDTFVPERFSFAAYGYKTKKYYWMHKK